ncbi:Gag-pol fusion polyprotein [Elysia marginata]|uniref:Gag-pol fusion polyprotein n=1 Tax=Elysia marginata TaxID=1093978 RepID=A0AAV4JYD1_9GAST|nr:Gag-pol fusion polyprotein [Elysia marginata]
MKSSVPLPPPGVFEEVDLYIRKRRRCVQLLADEFWRAWKGEYLATLQPRPKWQNPQRNIAVDDVVILHDDNVCRNEWKLASVVEAVPSADGLDWLGLARPSGSALQQGHPWVDRSTIVQNSRQCFRRFSTQIRPLPASAVDVRPINPQHPDWGRLNKFKTRIEI